MKSKDRRVIAELKKAGMTSYGLMKHETTYVLKLIKANEHIHGVVYGRIDDKIDGVMLVATDKRVLFIDCKPFYRYWDEITYEVVAGVKMSTVGPFAGVVLHTRVKEYSLRFVNINCAKTFVKYIEDHIEKADKPEPAKQPEDKKYQPYRMSKPKKKHTNDNTTVLDDTAVLSTVGKNGSPHASVVHYIIDKDDNFYFLTKSDTTKAKNIEYNAAVSMTIHPSQSLKVMYVSGLAKPVTNDLTKQQVIEHILQHRTYQEGVKLPPLIKMKSGSYIAFKIEPETKNLYDYSEQSW